MKDLRDDVGVASGTTFRPPSADVSPVTAGVEIATRSHESASTIAVLMAVHAGADPAYFAEALESMRRQTLAGIRVYLWCDGVLTDEHEAAVLRVCEQGLSMCLLRSRDSIGLAAGLNRLIDAALADPAVAFLARMDADDISLPTRLAAQTAFLGRHPDIAVVGTWCVEFTVPGVASFHKRLPTDPAEARRFMIYRSPLAHPTVMFRRQVFVAGYRYDPRLLRAQDYDLWARLLLGGLQLSNVPEYLLWYRMSGDFYGRRTGLGRAATELRSRYRYARAAGILRPHHLLGLASLFLIRVAPVVFKRLAYRVLR